MLASIRSSLLRPPTRPILTFSLSTTTTTTPPPPTAASPQEGKQRINGLTEIMRDINDASAQPRSAKKWRIFHQGDILQPSDLSSEKCVIARNPPRSKRATPSAPQARYNDIFQQLDLDPVDFTLNPHVLSTYISEMGKIYGRNITGLTSRSQRRLGKAIRRARMIGIIPQLSRPSKSWMINFRRHSRAQ